MYQLVNNIGRSTVRRRGAPVWTALIERIRIQLYAGHVGREHIGAAAGALRAYTSRWWSFDTVISCLLEGNPLSSA
jgi:hypothetical protein